MTRQPAFTTQDIDIAAAIMTATGQQPEIFRQPDHDLASFEFPANETVQAVVMAYASGELMQPVKRFAACRSWLYRQARLVNQRHGSSARREV